MSKKQTKRIQDRLNKILLKLNDDDDLVVSDSEIGSDSEIIGNKVELSGISEISSIDSIDIDSVFDRKSPKKQEIQQKQQKISKIPIRTKIDDKNLPRPSFKEQKIHPVVNYSQDAKQNIIKPEKPINFFAVDFSQFEHAIVCIYKGADFPRARQGERSTYVIMRLHDQLQELSTPISFDSSEAVYNAGFKLDTLGLDFENFTPVIEVYDFQGDNQRELLGVGYIQLQIAKRQEKFCTVLHDSWVNIYRINTHIKCGRVLMTLIFYDNEEDISGLIKNPNESVAEKKVEEKIPEPSRPVKKETAAVQAEVADIPIKEEDTLFESEDFNIPIRQETTWKTKVWGQEKPKINESFTSETSFHKRKPAKSNVPSNIKFVTELEMSDDDDSFVAEKENKTDSQQNVESSIISSGGGFFTKRRPKQNDTPKSKYTTYADYGYWN